MHYRVAACLSVQVAVRMGSEWVFIYVCIMLLVTSEPWELCAFLDPARYGHSCVV